jgi:hypothetical protein
MICIYLLLRKSDETGSSFIARVPLRRDNDQLRKAFPDFLICGSRRYNKIRPTGFAHACRM